MDDATKRELRTAADIAGLSQEFEELLACAERYVWLRDTAFQTTAARLVQMMPGEMDQAIDYEMEMDGVRAAW